MAPVLFRFPAMEIFAITDQTVKQSIMPLARNQQQVADCSHLIVLCVSTDIDEKRLDDYVRYISHARDTSVESLKGFKDRVMEAIIARPMKTVSSGLLARSISRSVSFSSPQPR